MFFHERDEVIGRVAGQRGFREVLVGADEIFGAAMDVREIAAPAPGDEDFLANAIGSFQYGNAASSFAGLGGAEESGCPGAEDEGVKFVRW